MDCSNRKRNIYEVCTIERARKNKIYPAGTVYWEQRERFLYQQLEKCLMNLIYAKCTKRAS